MNTQGPDEAAMCPALQPAHLSGAHRGLPGPVSRGGFRWGVGRRDRLLQGLRASAGNTSTPFPGPTPLGRRPPSGAEAGLGSSPRSAAPGEGMDRPESESMPHCYLTLPEPQFPLRLSGDNATSLARKFLLLPSPPCDSSVLRTLQPLGHPGPWGPSARLRAAVSSCPRAGAQSCHHRLRALPWHRVLVVRAATPLPTVRGLCPSRLSKEPTLCPPPPVFLVHRGHLLLSSAACGLPGPPGTGSHRSSRAARTRRQL